MTKQQFRQQALTRLRSIPLAQQYVGDKRVIATLYRTIKKRRARMVMLYVPMLIEVDVMPLIALLRREGVAVLVPFMEGASFRLVKYRLPLRIKKYGVKEPIISKQFRKKRIDISIVPIVGTDPTFRRIGFGKGMYDRFFAREKRYIQETIFVQRLLCYSQKIVTDSFDVCADTVVTASR